MIRLLFFNIHIYRSVKYSFLYEYISIVQIVTHIHFLKIYFISNFGNIRIIHRFEKLPGGMYLPLGYTKTLLNI